MNFYNLSELQFNKKSTQSIKSDGIPVELMSEIFMQLSKTTEFKTTESISGLELCYYDANHSLKENDAIVVSGEVNKRRTKTKYSFLKKNSVVEFQNENNDSLFITVLGETLHSSSDLEAINNILKKKSEKKFPSEGHKAAYAWLESGEVGMSSLTLCAAMFPDLDHETLQRHKSKEQINYPYDFGDFGRCYKFIQAIPEGAEKLKTLSLGTEWSNIISNWSSIESGYLSEDSADRETSYNLLQRCIGRTKKLKS